MNSELSPEDLLVLARQGELGDQDQHRLHIALQASRELELLHEAGMGFDAEALGDVADDARLRRLVERTLARAPRAVAAGTRAQPRRRIVRSFVAGLGIGAISAVVLGSAWRYAEERRWVGGAGEHAGQSPRIARRVLGAAAPASAVPTFPSKPEASAAPPLAAPAPAPRAARAITHEVATARASGSSSLPQPSVLSASALFSSASEARRAGDGKLALALYRQLCVEFPGSAEAADAKILIGDLLLAEGAAAAALAEFESYGAGALAPEALWGRARALRRLGSPEERAVLERLVREHPGSPYGSAARTRLRELSR